MTTGPTDVKVTTAAGGPGGMPLALKLNEGLGRICVLLTCRATALWARLAALKRRVEMMPVMSFHGISLGKSLNRKGCRQ